MAKSKRNKDVLLYESAYTEVQSEERKKRKKKHEHNSKRKKKKYNKNEWKKMSEKRTFAYKLFKRKLYKE